MGKLTYVSAKVLLLAGVIAQTSVAQSLSIQLSTPKLTIEAAAPANLGYRIQSSVDHENWEDISDQAAGAFSFSINPSEAAHRFFRLRTWITDDAPMTVIMIGDSTMTDFASASGQYYGWGEGMHDVFKPNVRFVNFAVPVQSSKTFLASSQRQNMEAVKPEFVVVQFGMVDEYPGGGATTLPEYEANLRNIIQMIRGFKGTPILVTPLPVRIFDETGRAIPWLVERCEVVRRLSAELQTYLIDLNTLITDLYNELGPTNSAHITWPGDPAHFTLAGTEIISEVVVGKLPNILAEQVVEVP